MKTALAFWLLFVIVAAAPSPAPAQNIWPISFDFWGHHPDKLAADIQRADESIAHAQALGRLYDIQIRPAMNQRAGNMSLQELGLYNRQPLFTAVYPDVSEPAPSATPSSPSAPASGAPPASSGTPFPSGTPKPASTAPAPSAPAQTVPAAPFAPGPETTPSTSAAPTEPSGTAPKEPKP